MMSQLGRPIMSKDLSNHTRHANNTPAVKRGRTRVSPVPDMTASSPEGPSAPRHPACLLFTITSEQDNGGHRHAPLQNLSLIYGCSARHQGLVEPARPLPSGKAKQKAQAATPNDVWWSQTGSNRRPQACKASALPTELWPQFRHLNTNQNWLA